MVDPAPEETRVKFVVPKDQFRCKKNDGKDWRCNRWRIHEKAVCEYHYLRGLQNAAKKKSSTRTPRARVTESRFRVSKGKGKGWQDDESDDEVIPLKKRAMESRSKRKRKRKGLQGDESEDEVIPEKKRRNSVAYLGESAVGSVKRGEGKSVGFGSVRRRQRKNGGFGLVSFGKIKTLDKKVEDGVDDEEEVEEDFGSIIRAKRNELRAKKMLIASSETNDQSEGKDDEVKEEEENSEVAKMEEKDDSTLREEGDGQSVEKDEKLRDEEGDEQEKEEVEGDEKEKEGNDLRVDQKEEEKKGVSNGSSPSPEEEENDKKKKDNKKSRSATKLEENEVEKRSYRLRIRNPKYEPQPKDRVDGRRRRFSKDGNGEDNCNMCHQCQKSDRRVVRCSQGCRRRFCGPCIERW